MTGRGQKIVDLMNRRRININCVQETKWKGCKAREIGNGFKFFYNGRDGKCNGVGIILNDDIKKGVLSVKRQSDRIIWMRVDLEGEIVNIMSAYAPQMDYDEYLEYYLREIPKSERLWIGDFNGHCGSNNRGKDTIGIYGVGVSNVAGDQLVDFAMSYSPRTVNTFFKKAERTG
nr:craniofacial development protein 2-like [Penaeus vannamei]